jgi:hypothetical protein
VARHRRTRIEISAEAIARATGPADKSAVKLPEDSVVPIDSTPMTDDLVSPIRVPVGRLAAARRRGLAWPLV